MERKDFLEGAHGRCRIWVDASPGTSKSEVAGVNPWRKALQVKIAAEAREGKANEELVAFLAEVLSVPRKEVRILKGERSGTKLVEVPLGAEDVRRRLGV